MQFLSIQFVIHSCCLIILNLLFIFQSKSKLTKTKTQLRRDRGSMSSLLLRVRHAQPLRWRRLLSTVGRESEKAIEKHAKETATQWKWISLLVGFPTCGFLLVRSFIFEDHEEHHKEHIPYEHIRIRKVPFPWGSESLFHTKHNYSPDDNSGEEESAAEAKEHFITAWLRRKMEENKKSSDKILAECLRADHQKMMEYIERKKFTHYPPLPSYIRMFGEPQLDLTDHSVRRPVSFNDQRIYGKKCFHFACSFFFIPKIYCRLMIILLGLLCIKNISNITTFGVVVVINTSLSFSIYTHLHYRQKISRFLIIFAIFNVVKLKFEDISAVG